MEDRVVYDLYLPKVKVWLDGGWYAYSICAEYAKHLTVLYNSRFAMLAVCGFASIAPCVSGLVCEALIGRDTYKR